MKKDTFEDDGRTIVDMSMTKQDSLFTFSRNAIKKENKFSYVEASEKRKPVPMTKSELRQYMLSATLAGLLIGLAFIGGAFVFIWFCVNIWFR